ncbi:MAG: acyl-CoA dehydrogenase family protein, partial [Gallionellaceae bacterium]
MYRINALPVCRFADHNEVRALIITLTKPVCICAFSAYKTWANSSPICDPSSTLPAPNLIKKAVMTYLEKLNNIIRDIIEPAAIATDRDAVFPRAAISALGEAGLLGLTSASDVGGLGLGLAEAAQTVERIAQACPSTAMVLTMHYSATAVIEKFGSDALRRDVAAGRHLSTLAWSESGSRSHFWAPLGTAVREGEGYLLDGSKTVVTSALEADSYIWSSRPAQVEGASTLWLVGSK